MRDGLFGGFWLQIAGVGARPIPEGDTVDTLALCAFMAQGVARPFVNGFAFPLADRAHDRDHQAAGGRAGIQSLSYRDERDLALLEQRQQSTGEAVPNRYQSIRAGQSAASLASSFSPNNCASAIAAALWRESWALMLLS